MKNQTEEEMIKKRNDGQECDQWEKEHKHTHQKESRKENKKNHEMERRCVECKEKFESLDKIIEHINKNECGGWTCCETYLRKQEEKEYRNMNGQGRETEDNKIKDTEREEKTQENEERYTKEDEHTLTIKEPDIAKGLTKNN